MAGLSRLHFDRARRDFVINGQSLLAHLAKHEGIDPSMYRDVDGWHQFSKVRGYRFGRAEYLDALRGAAAT